MDYVFDKKIGLPFKYYVLEIASLLVIGIKGSKLVFRGYDSNPEFAILLNEIVLVTLNSEGYTLPKSVDEVKRTGLWSNFLEGGPDEISKHILRKLAFVGYECVYPDRLNPIVNPLPFKK